MQRKVDNFKGGQLRFYKKNWKSLTFDPEILTTISGATIEFDSIPPVRHTARNIRLDEKDISSLDSEIDKLLSKHIIVPYAHEDVEFFSPIFPVSNSDSSIRMILNLKTLNSHITYHHFKMDTISTVLQNLTPNCFMASIDLKSAYYSVPIDEQYQRYEI